jgi:hypothetical protein
VTLGACFLVLRAIQTEHFATTTHYCQKLDVLAVVTLSFELFDQLLQILNTVVRWQLFLLLRQFMQEFAVCTESTGIISKVVADSLFHHVDSINDGS